jgi:hypothetical protein
MRIEKINEELLTKATPEELKECRFKFIQLFNQYHGNKKFSEIAEWPEFMAKYMMLRTEMEKRFMPIGVESSIERFINKAGPMPGFKTSLSPEDQKSYDDETALIFENSMKADAQKSHKFQPAKWTTSWGSPRCLKCGNDEPVGGICKGWKKSPARYDAGTWGLALDKADLEVIEKPYPNEHAARLSDPGKFDRFGRTKGGKIYGGAIVVPASIDIIWGHPKNGPPKAAIPQALRFPIKDWTEAEARKWLKDNKIKFISFEPAKEEKKAIDDGESEAIFKILKKDAAQQIVGGIVYEPNAVDTQGDWTDAAEIQKTMYGFMMKYAEQPSRIKIMHKGTAHMFPILECFQPEHDTKKGDGMIKAGAWWMMIKITDAGVWAEIEAGAITGLSMGGFARRA